MRGAQYAARLAFPSKIVCIRGNPNARVLWEEQNTAATTSPRENPKTGSEKSRKSPASDAKWSVGRSVNKTKL
jgi:hypothetical protein